MASSAGAGSITLLPVADTTLSQRYPENNFGAMPFFNSGTTQNGNFNRGLIQFDLAGVLPPGARITSATLTLEVVGDPDEEFPSARFNLHRLLVPWGEGRGTNSPGGGMGVGSPALTGEANWDYRFVFSDPWSQLGAAAPDDFVATASAGVTAGGVDQSPYTIASTAQLVADLQLWLDQPATNLGWIVVCQQENTRFTARRFGSREDPENAPQLEIIFEVPAPQIESIERIGDQIVLRFTAQPGKVYTVEYCDDVNSPNWRPLAYAWTPDAPKQFQISNTITGPQRFYRLNTQ